MGCLTVNIKGAFEQGISNIHSAIGGNVNIVQVCNIDLGDDTVYLSTNLGKLITIDNDFITVSNDVVY